MFFIVSIINIVLSGIATILSDLSFDGDLTAQAIWGQHFNIGTDLVTLVGSIVQFCLVGKKTEWTRRHSIDRGRSQNRALWFHDCRAFILSILVLSLSILGILSSIASTYTPSETHFAKIGGWYVGMIAWIVGSFLFVVSEFELIYDMWRAFYG